MCLLLLGFPVTAEADARWPAWDLVFRKDRRTVQVYATDGSSRVLLDEQELGWFRPFFGSVRFTADLDGDGLPEAVVGQFTGGCPLLLRVHRPPLPLQQGRTYTAV